jgi:hypothetical protein
MSFGGMHEIDVNNEDVIKIAQFAVSALQGQSNSMAPLRLSRVIEAKSQVVAGVKYELLIEVNLGDKPHVEHVEIYQHWSGQMTLQNHYPVNV